MTLASRIWPWRFKARKTLDSETEKAGMVGELSRPVLAISAQAGIVLPGRPSPPPGPSVDQPHLTLPAKAPLPAVAGRERKVPGNANQGRAKSA